jgi:hypothetical protein
MRTRVLLVALLAAALLPALAAADDNLKTTITSGPPDPVASSSATFTFVSTDPQAHFACALDSEAFRGCTSPLTRTAIPDGRHTLFVFSIDGRDREKNPAYWTWTVDTTPPGPATGVHADVGYRRVALTWTPPADADHVVITRSTSAKQVTGKEVFRGRAHRYHERKFDNAGFHRYTLVIYDKAGNASAPVAVEVKPSALLLTPQEGAVVRAKRAPLLRWRSIPGARYYNVQLWRGGRKILSAWPLKPRFALRGTWTYQGHDFSLKRGNYTWFVWPSMRRFPAVAYGPLAGQSTFRVR